MYKQSKKSKMEAERLEMERKERRSRWIKYGIAGAAVLGSLTLGASRFQTAHVPEPTVPQVSDSRASQTVSVPDLRDRHRLYSERLAGTEYTPQPLPKFSDAFGFAKWLGEAEDTFSQSADAFLSYLKTQEKRLFDLTGSDFERFGYVTFHNGTFDLIDKSSTKEQVIRYMKEILQGDFSHDNDLLDILNYRFEETGLSGGKEKLATVVALASLRSKKEYDNLSSEQQKTFQLRLYTDKGPITHPVPDFEELYSNSVTLFEGMIRPVSGVLIGSTPVYPEAFARPEIISRWHTHQLDDPNYMPSPPDESNTYVMGPNALFSRRDGTLRVYTMIKGTSKEIYTISVR